MSVIHTHTNTHTSHVNWWGDREGGGILQVCVCVCVCACVTNSGQLMSDIMHMLDEASNNNLIIIPKREKEGVS